MIKWYRLKYRLKKAIRLIIKGEEYDQRFVGRVIITPCDDFPYSNGVHVGMNFQVEKVFSRYKDRVIEVTIKEV